MCCLIRVGRVGLVGRVGRVGREIWKNALVVLIFSLPPFPLFFTPLFPFIVEYDLIVKPDINTRGHTQWFYFSVSNTKKGVPIKFNLINMYKGDSLYNRGMRPLMYSQYDSSILGKKETGEKVGWRRCGTDVCYYQNHIKRKGGHYYTASFTITFPHDQDTVYLAYCYPYTYSDLQVYLKEL